MGRTVRLPHCLFLCGVIFLLTWPKAVMCTPLDDVKSDFLAWVDRVGKAHQAGLAAGTVGTASENLAARKAGGGKIVVDQGGAGNYKTVQEAVNAAGGGGRVVIQINAGTYKEKIKIPSGKTITFQGNGNPVLVWGDTANSAGSTFSSASVAVNSDDFIATGVTFKNSAPAPPGGAVGRQAVALRVSGDRAAFYDCSFYGAQDTLYDHQGRHYFKNCYIQGSIDFIFGDGKSLYQSCTLHSIASGSGSLTAQNRGSGSEDTGFSFVGCTVTGSGPVYLGRAWGPYSRVVFANTYIGNLIYPAGWFNWGDSSREKTVFYGQYQCSGPGASESGRVAWSHELSASQAAPFMDVSFVNGNQWLQS